MGTLLKSQPTIGCQPTLKSEHRSYGYGFYRSKIWSSGFLFIWSSGFGLKTQLRKKLKTAKKKDFDQLLAAQRLVKIRNMCT